MFVEGFVIGTRQPGVEGVLDGQFELRPRAGFLPPVQDQQLIEAAQQVAGYFLDLGALSLAKLRRDSSSRSMR